MTASPKSSSEQQAIQSQVDRFVDAWNNHDTRAMSMMFAEDGDLINPFGRVAKSRADIEKLFQDEHATSFKDTRFSLKPEGIRLLGQEAAIGDYAFEVTSKTTALSRGHVTMVFRKDGDRWLAQACRPMIPAPRPQS